MPALSVRLFWDQEKSDRHTQAQGWRQGQHGRGAQGSPAQLNGRRLEAGVPGVLRTCSPGAGGSAGGTDRRGSVTRPVLTSLPRRGQKPRRQPTVWTVLTSCPHRPSGGPSHAHSTPSATPAGCFGTVDLMRAVATHALGANAPGQVPATAPEHAEPGSPQSSSFLSYRPTKVAMEIHQDRRHLPRLK